MRDSEDTLMALVVLVSNMAHVHPHNEQLCQLQQGTNNKNVCEETLNVFFPS